MRGFEMVALAIVALFVIGIGVGVLCVISLPAFRRRRGVGWDGEDRRRPGRRPPGWEEPPGPGDNDGPGWQEPPGPEDDDTPPRWPGGTSA